MTKLVQLTREDGVAIVELADPLGKNALGEAMVMELRACLAEAYGDPSCRTVVVCGSPEVFCSGAPRELLVRLTNGEVLPSDIALAAALLDVPVPTITAMEGHATGGGLALGLCADIIVLARESRYGATFMNMGFTPGMGMTRLLEHVLSPAIAHELLYTGELRRGSELEGRGINHVLPRSEVRARAIDIARRIADKPRRSLELLKETLAAPRRAAFAASRVEEERMHAITFADPATRTWLDAEYIDSSEQASTHAASSQRRT